MLRDKMGQLGKPTIPPAYEFLYQPARYKVVKGGRGKGASWSFARTLVYLAHTRKLLIVCTREVQNSIADSVHRLICDQIAIMGCSEFFRITQNSIKSLVSDSEFIFRGLSDLTADNIKSLEGADIVWCAEAHAMGARSWRILPPTVRKPNSEIWVDYNPEEENAPTHQKFTTNCPANAIVKHINFDQNPYFTAELEAERQDALAMIANALTDDAREQNQLEYNNVWLGETRKIGKASIFGAYFTIDEFTPVSDSKEWDGPYDGADWGFSCLGGDTLVKTITGSVPIKNVRAGDYVLTRDGYKKVNFFVNKGIKGVYELDCGLRSPIIVTGDHRIYTQNGWKRVEELAEIETLCTIKSSLKEKFINYILTAKSLIIDPNLVERKTKKHLSCIVKFGNLFMGKFQKVCSFITLMVTKLTTPLKTCFAFLFHSMRKFISVKISELYQSVKCQKFVKNLDTLKKIGQTGVKNLLKPLEIVSNVALNVIKKFLLPMFIRSFVAQIAEKNQILGTVKKNIFAKFAALNSWLLPTTQEKLVIKPVRINLRKLKEKTEVFDISVENREFFANGLLVHNCDPTVRIRAWVHNKPNGRKNLCIEREAYGIGVETKDIPAMFDVFPDSRKVKIRGDNARPETISQLKNDGFNIIAADKWKGSVEDGIEHIRGAYDLIVVHPRCKETANEMRLYSYKTDRLTGDITRDILDKNNHCLTAETLVETDNGAIPIVDLVGKEGFVKTLHGLKRFHSVRMTSPSEMIYKIETEKGSIHCTSDHLILTDKGWIPAIALSKKYRIVSIGNDANRYKDYIWKENLLNLKEKNFISQKAVIIFATLLCTFTEKFGLSIMVKNLQQGIISTIKTMIKPTMILKTLKSYLASSIKPHMKKKCCQPIEKSVKLDLLKMFKSQLRNGINQMLVGDGIKSITKKWGISFMKKLFGNAHNVLRMLKRQEDTRLPFAQTLANLVTGENSKLITFQGNALIVKNSLASTDIAKLNVAHGAAGANLLMVKKITRQTKKPVYNMEVEDVHHFAINGGFIVHNCLDGLRYALTPLITRKKGSHLFS